MLVLAWESMMSWTKEEACRLLRVCVSYLRGSGSM